MIKKPGIYRLSAEVYHGACTAKPALSSTGAREIASECPAYHRHRNPHLNPDWKSDYKREFAIGTSAHLLFLEPEAFDDRTVIVDADNYQTKAAKTARDDAHEAGKSPLLMKERDLVFAMREALNSDPLARTLIGQVTTEETIVWIDDVTGCWCKARPDIRPNHRRYAVDYKTAASAEPSAFERSAWNYRYWQQAAWYLDAIEAMHGERPAAFFFLCQAKDPPYLVTVHRVDDGYLEWGELENRKARETFARCLETGRWPGYADKALPLKPPAYAERQLKDGADAGRYAPAPTPDQLRRAAEMQAPLKGEAA